jgi:signal peptidase I
MSAAKTRTRAPWRENIEALVGAVVVALAFKVFFLEVSKIPSGSMQPTLMGSPEVGVFDRVLVDKLTYTWREPERFEVVVFQHPLMRSLTMVKRLVGMPGEDLKIEDGDLWVRPDASAPWRALRRPPAVQRAMWRALDARGWGAAQGRSRLEAERELAYQPAGGAIVDGYLDGYPGSLRSRIPVRNPFAGQHAVGDLRLELEARAEPGLRTLELELLEGPRAYVLELPGPAAPADARARLRIEERPALGQAPQAHALELADWRLSSSDATRVALQNLDNEIAVELDGQRALTLEIESVRNQQSGARVRARGGAAVLEELALARDTYYTSERSTTRAVSIPNGHYFLLGDNSVDSADGREWQSMRFAWVDASGEAQTARGNWRPGGNRPGDNNPIRGIGPAGEDATALIDEWGERRLFPSSGSSRQGPEPSPLVPAELVRGRALAVFWPLRPDLGVWRWGWVR